MLAEQLKSTGLDSWPLAGGSLILDDAYRIKVEENELYHEYYHVHTLDRHIAQD